MSFKYNAVLIFKREAKMETNLHTESLVNSRAGCTSCFSSLMRADVLGYRTREF